MTLRLRYVALSRTAGTDPEDILERCRISFCCQSRLFEFSGLIQSRDFFASGSKHVLVSAGSERERR
jgi:hypothetical protein